MWNRSRQPGRPRVAFDERETHERSHMNTRTYESVCVAHSWEVPERYNIAADVCDKHPREKLAMIWESFDGAYREVTWGELQDLANKTAHILAARGVEKGDRVAVVLPPTPEAAAVFFAVWKLGAILLSMSVLYGEDGIRHRLSDSSARLLRHRRRKRAALRRALRSRRRNPVCGDNRSSSRKHRCRRPRSALLHLRHHGARERHRACASVHPWSRGVRVLPRGRGR